MRFKNFLQEEDLTLRVSAKDAKKAKEILDDSMSGSFKANGQNKFIFKNKDDYYEASDLLDDHGIAIMENKNGF